MHSLEAKHSVVRPIMAEIKRRSEVSVAETGDLELPRRAGVLAGLVAVDATHVIEVLDGIERLVAARPEVDLLSARRRLHSSEDQ